MANHGLEDVRRFTGHAVLRNFRCFPPSGKMVTNGHHTTLIHVALGQLERSATEERIKAYKSQERETDRNMNWLKHVETLRNIDRRFKVLESFLMPRSVQTPGDPVTPSDPWAHEHSSCEGDPEISSQRSTGFASWRLTTSECTRTSPLRNSYGIPMEFLWNSYETPMELLWSVEGCCFPCHTWVQSESGTWAWLGFRACKQPTPIRTLKRW